jgi:hypothetical protein
LGLKVALYLRDKAERGLKEIIADTGVMGEKPKEMSTGRRLSGVSSMLGRGLMLVQVKPLPDRPPVIEPRSKFDGLGLSESTREMFTRSALDLPP